jgi:type IV pilus assembly protein PilA
MATSGTRAPRSRRRAGFGLLELIIVVLIIGAMASVALPEFMIYQNRSKSAEAKTNLGAIRVAEESYFSEFETYLSAAPEPALIPGGVSVPFDAAGSGFAPLGFETEGNVYFSYGVAASADGVGYTVDAGADIDQDGIVQFWGYSKVDGLGNVVPSQVGCNETALVPLTIGPCSPTAGQTVF